MHKLLETFSVEVTYTMLVVDNSFKNLKIFMISYSKFGPIQKLDVMFQDIFREPFSYICQSLLKHFLPNEVNGYYKLSKMKICDRAAVVAVTTAVATAGRQV